MLRTDGGPCSASSRSQGACTRVRSSVQCFPCAISGLWPRGLPSAPPCCVRDVGVLSLSVVLSSSECGRNDIIRCVTLLVAALAEFHWHVDQGLFYGFRAKDTACF